MKLRKLAAFVLSGALLASMFTGCADKSKKEDQDTLTINFGIRNIEPFIEGLSSKFPDINFVIEPTYCVNQSSYLRAALLSGNSGDIFYYTHKPDGAEAAEHLLDLSGYDFISNFDRAVINTYLVDGHVYCIPGPMTLRGVAYNKTLFERHGWKKPGSYKELVALCRQIRAETDDIIPIAMSLGGLAYPFSLVTTFSQAGFLGSPAGEAWEKRYKAGEGSVAEGWGEGLEMTAELIDAGAFSVEDYIGVWDDKACNMDFAEGRAAMFIMWAGQPEMLQMIEDNTEYEYAFMPFFGKEEGEVMIGAVPNFTWGISKRLGEKGNEKKLKNALRVMEWFSTPEAQELMKTYITDADGKLIPTSAEMTPLAAAEEDRESSPYFRELWEQAEKGNKIPMIYSGYESVIINAGQIVQDAMIAGTSEGMTEKFVKSVDKDYKDFLEGGEKAVLCTVTDDFTKEQTAQLLANGINEAGLGDFTLITYSGRTGVGIENKVGAGGRYFKGTITSQDYNIILGSTKNLQIMELTGAQVKKLLSDGKRVYSTVNEGEYTDYPYYWAGIEVSLGEDGSVKSSNLNDSTKYKVVFTYDDYTRELAETAGLSDTGISLADYWLDYISMKKVLSPPEVMRKN